MKTTDVLQAFLRDSQALPFYTPEMEVQVNVRTDIGERVTGTYNNHTWHGFTNGEYTWKSIRSPWGAKTSTPHFEDRDLTWPLDKFAEGIGCTGWNWVKKESIYCGFDFDSIVNHAQGLNAEEMAAVKQRLEQIPWVSIYTSKSGKGIHAYVRFDTPVSTDTHTHHAGLARAVLSNLSALVGFNFKEKVDTCGGILWIWHRQTKPEGLKLLKQGSRLTNIPPNWKDHLEIIEKKRRVPGKQIKNKEDFEGLVSRTRKADLNEEHLALLKWFNNQNTTWWWDADFGMLVCHTYDLKRAHQALGLRGIYETISSGIDVPYDQNCFGFALPNGKWIFRRHGKGTAESPFWDLDRAGWRYCIFNSHPSLGTVSRMFGGTPSTGNKHFFEMAINAERALVALGSPLQFPPELATRSATLKEGERPGTLVIQIDRSEGDKNIVGWAPVRGPKWEQIISIKIEEEEIEIPDDIVRHIVQDGKDLGWVVQSRSGWILESKGNVVSFLVSKGVDRGIIDPMLGNAIANHWEIVRIPFANEYPGQRQWNKDAPQLAFQPNDIPHPTWDKLLQHIGKGLNDAVSNDPWCRKYEILSGAQYLCTWISALFKYPTEPLPYLFLFGPQESGKSTLHEAIALLFKGRVGYVGADAALVNQAGFNGELDGSVLCVVEEVNLTASRIAYDRIKDWVTSRNLTIHVKGKTPYTTNNTTHWIQCANDATNCPILPGDTRIIVNFVSGLREQIPKPALMDKLIEEAPGFLNKILTLEIPESNSRLRVPVIKTQEKKNLEETNRPEIEVFFSEEVYSAPGYAVRLGDVFNAYCNWAGTHSNGNYRRFSRQVPPHIIKGIYGGQNQTYLGNIRINAVHMVPEFKLGANVILTEGKLREGMSVSDEQR